MKKRYRTVFLLLGVVCLLLGVVILVSCEPDGDRDTALLSGFNTLDSDIVVIDGMPCAVFGKWRSQGYGLGASCDLSKYNPRRGGE